MSVLFVACGPIGAVSASDSVTLPPNVPTPNMAQSNCLGVALSSRGMELTNRCGLVLGNLEDVRILHVYTCPKFIIMIRGVKNYFLCLA